MWWSRSVSRERLWFLEALAWQPQELRGHCVLDSLTAASHLSTLIRLDLDEGGREAGGGTSQVDDQFANLGCSLGRVWALSGPVWF